MESDSLGSWEFHRPSLGPRFGRPFLCRDAHPKYFLLHVTFVLDPTPYLQAGPSDGQPGQSRPLTGMSSEREIDSQALNLSAARSNSATQLPCHPNQASRWALRGVYMSWPQIPPRGSCPGLVLATMVFSLSARQLATWRLDRTKAGWLPLVLHGIVLETHQSRRIFPVSRATHAC